MNATEEMPVEVLLDAWYTKYENQEVYFPVLVGASAVRVDFKGRPLLTAMWQLLMKSHALPLEREQHTRKHYVFHINAYTVQMAFVNGGLYAARLHYKGA